jgi:hypothetical protein
MCHYLYALEETEVEILEKDSARFQTIVWQAQRLNFT